MTESMEQCYTSDTEGSWIICTRCEGTGDLTGQSGTLGFSGTCTSCRGKGRVKLLSKIPYDVLCAIQNETEFTSAWKTLVWPYVQLTIGGADFATADWDTVATKLNILWKQFRGSPCCHEKLYKIERDNLNVNKCTACDRLWLRMQNPETKSWYWDSEVPSGLVPSSLDDWACCVRILQYTRDKWAKFSSWPQYVTCATCFRLWKLREEGSEGQYSHYGEKLTEPDHKIDQLEIVRLESVAMSAWELALKEERSEEIRLLQSQLRAKELIATQMGLFIKGLGYTGDLTEEAAKEWLEAQILRRLTGLPVLPPFNGHWLCSECAMWQKTERYDNVACYNCGQIWASVYPTMIKSTGCRYNNRP